jgi:hypothetical protein
VFSLSKANSANDKGNPPAGKKENAMSFHKVTPVKKSRQPAKPAPKQEKKKAPKRPVKHGR